VSRKFTYWNHIGSFLEFESLLIDEGAFLVDDDVWVHGTWIAVFARKFSAIAGTWEGDSR
jgi:hypothetical protein